jgi:hypothetical protein
MHYDASLQVLREYLYYKFKLVINNYVHFVARTYADVYAD